MIINNIKSYILSVLKSLYRENKEMISTQEENYYNMSSERINILNKNYIAAILEFNQDDFIYFLAKYKYINKYKYQFNLF